MFYRNVPQICMLYFVMCHHDNEKYGPYIYSKKYWGLRLKISTGKSTAKSTGKSTGKCVNSVMYADKRGQWTAVPNLTLINVQEH